MEITKILLLEDDPTDVEIITRLLYASPDISPEIRVSDRPDAFMTLLKSFAPDIILADYRLPQFSGLEALDVAGK